MKTTTGKIDHADNRGFNSIHATLLALLLALCNARAQGTVNFDAHPNFDGTNYVELGMQFRLIIPQGSSYDPIGITYGAGNTPGDGTPFMWWFRQSNPYNYAELSLTNGSMFGFTSVLLADPTAPSPSPVPISFVGYFVGGSTITNTFDTPGNGATTFSAYDFSSGFASGLTKVDIFAPRWAMDNLAFTVPEPSCCVLLALGVASFVLRRRAR
jgi:hypothetical protein